MFNSKKLTIILPGKIGDIIICLPIAKYYYDKGYTIYWPIYDFLISNFNKGHIDYVNFIPVNFLTSIEDSFTLAKKNQTDVLDLSFTSHGCWDNQNSKNFLSQKEIPFDKFRYNLSKVDFNLKWSLHINRDIKREKSLFGQIVKNEKFVVYQFKGSDTEKRVQFDNKNDMQLIEIQPYTDCVFDWIYTLEKSEYIVLIDSCFANIVEQLNLKNKKYFIKRSEYIKTPTLKNVWSVVKK